MSTASRKLIFSLFLLFVTSCAPSDWSTFSPPSGGNFSVELPGHPEEKVSSGSRENIHFTVHAYTLKPWFAVTKISYSIVTMDFQVPDSATWNEEKALEGIKLSLMKQLGANVTGEQPIEMAGRSGREILFSHKNGTLTARILPVGHRHYILAMNHPEGKDFSADKSRFFNSFKFVQQ